MPDVTATSNRAVAYETGAESTGVDVVEVLVAGHSTAELVTTTRVVEVVAVRPLFGPDSSVAPRSEQAAIDTNRPR
jgi:hypothetical protein